MFLQIEGNFALIVPICDRIVRVGVGGRLTIIGQKRTKQRFNLNSVIPCRTEYMQWVICCLTPTEQLFSYIMAMFLQPGVWS